jgi:hypothetical protein
MMKISGLALALAIAAAPTVLEAQTPRGGGQERALRAEVSPSIAMLLQRRADLGLSTEQVTRLEAIEQRLREQNAPLMEQLRAHEAFKRSEGAARLPSEQRRQLRERMQNLTPEQREAMRERRESGGRGPLAAGTGRAVPEELRPVVQQLQANTREALSEAREVLTEEQETKLRELVRQQRVNWRDRAGASRGARGGR